jgi:hypothetical protein
MWATSAAQEALGTMARIDFLDNRFRGEDDGMVNGCAEIGRIDFPANVFGER